MAWKIILANGAILLGTLVIGGRLFSTSGSNPLPLMVTAGGVLVASALLNAILVHLALVPVADLQRTAERVRDGNPEARTPPSALADPGIDRLRVVFNAMLDQAALLNETQRMRSRMMLDAEERDRERLSDGLWGDTAQTLAAILVQLRLMDQAIARGEDHRSAADSLAVSLRLALADVRRVARVLRPPELDDMGVRTAIEVFARQLTEDSGAGAVDLRIEGSIPDDRLDDRSRLLLFRILQEATRNAIQHAGASRIRIEFATSVSELTATITDDGRGFDSGALLRDGQPGFGVLAMTERARFADGTLTVESRPSRGSRIALQMPLTDSTRTPQPSLSGISVPAVLS